jgi:hypothetical protein
MTTCKYGDELCPCQDGDLCHYEGENAMKPPMDSRLWCIFWAPFNPHTPWGLLENQQLTGMLSYSRWYKVDPDCTKTVPIKTLRTVQVQHRAARVC